MEIDEPPVSSLESFIVFVGFLWVFPFKLMLKFISQGNEKNYQDVTTSNHLIPVNRGIYDHDSKLQLSVKLWNMG